MREPKAVTAGLSPWIVELSMIAQEQERRAFLKRVPGYNRAETVEKLYEAVMSLVRVDLQRAERLAESAAWIAGGLKDPYSQARSARAVGHVLCLSGRYKEAMGQYNRAISGFEQLGFDLDVATTITSGTLQCLGYEGEYEEAFHLGEKARAIFQARDDKLRLARLDSNLANVLYRQDRFQEAVELYERAHPELMREGEALDVTILLRNMAVCYISLNDFDRAQQAYEQTRRYCEEQRLPLVIVEADYNIAYLYYLKGEYLRAIELYDKTRRSCEEVGDKYHRALCDLDESEIYLELNLTEGGEELARNAFRGFQELELRYEAAKAAAFSAIALSQQGHHQRSLLMFDEARDLFVNERNQLWPALIDLYKALVLCESGNDEAAFGLATSALEYFGPSPLPAKAAICELLLADIDLRFAETENARRCCNSALARLVHMESPALYQAYFMLGQVEEASGNTELARQAYEKAHERLEDLRSSLGKEELKIAFLKNKLDVYEGLVLTSLAIDKGQHGTYKAFEYIERAKSRSLADLIAFRTSSLEARTGMHPGAMEPLQELRQKLNWAYHQIELEELNPGERSPERIGRLRRQGREFEDQLMKAFSQAQSEGRQFIGLQSAAPPATVEELQSTLPADSALIEYYAARNWFYACVFTQKGLNIFPVAEVGQVREHLRLLQLQIAKFRLGEDYIRPLRRILLEATNYHLQNLDSLLIAPIRHQLQASHLTFVPHGFLHYLPFHALLNGDRALIDDYSISYAPSATVFAMCQQKQTASEGPALVLAVPDQRAPHIREEGEYVAAALNQARLFVGEKATEEQLRKYGPQSRFIHIATHGYFRQDNPMFSSIRLGDSLLSLFDLYQLNLQAELVTLSGCGTGMNAVIGGDELIGLVRGLLYAGAQSLMVSLWEVHDQSTSEFMRDFYDLFKRGANKASALRHAVLNLRQRQPHPYFWGAFALVGRIS